MNPGLQELAYIPRVSRGVGQSARAAAGALDRGRAEASLWAYCRELCGPAAGDRAVAAIVTAIEAGPAILTENELLLLTRTTAAGFAGPASNGSRYTFRPPLGADCAETPARLAAELSGALSPTERQALGEHLDDCLPCKAIRIRLKRAERGFATLWNQPLTARPQLDMLSSVTPADLETEVGSARAEAAVRAYCRELCGPTGYERAVADALYTAGLGVRSESVPAYDLLRMTRFAAADHASRAVSAQAQGAESSAGRSLECAETPTHLAVCANGGLGSGQQARHVDDCVSCSAIRIRMERAERAFSLALTAPTETMTAVPLAAEAAVLEAPDPVPAAPRAPTARPAAPTARSARRRAAPKAPAPRRAAAKAPAPRRAAAPKPSATPRPERFERPERPRPGGGAAAESPRPNRAASVAPPAPWVPAPPPEDPAPIRRRRLVALAAALIAAAAVAAGLVLSGNGGHTARGPSASCPRHVVGSTPATPATPAPASRTSAKATPARHRAPAKAKRTAKPHRPAARKHTTPAPAASVPVAAPVVVQAAPPPASTPAPTAPVAAAPSSPPAKKVSTPSVTPQGTNLPAQVAPIQGIGGH